MERIDAERLQQLIDTHGAALTLYARQWCVAPEDALQEALIELARQEPAPDRPIAWLFKTVRRRAMNIARGDRRRTNHYRRAGQERPGWFVDESDGGDGFDPDALAAMLERLPNLEREIVVARIWGELSYEGIAELVELSSSSVHRRYRRALSLLGDMMNGKLETPSRTDESKPPTAKRPEL